MADVVFFADTSEFPALGGGSSYASQAQQSGMFMSQPQGPLSGGIQPPGPPPGISAPGTAGGQGQGQTNGLREENPRGSGDEFPALGGMNGAGQVSSEAKDRVSQTAVARAHVLISRNRYQTFFVITDNMLKHRHHLLQHYPMVHPAHIRTRSHRQIRSSSI